MWLTSLVCKWIITDVITNARYSAVPWASYQIRKIAGCACAGNAGNVFPRRRFQRKPLVGDPGMHHGTCVTHVPWCMSGSLICGDGENVPGIPGACAPATLRIWQEAHYNVVSFLLDPHKRYPTARPWGRGMGYIFWSLMFDLYSPIVIAALNVIAWQMWPRYKGTRLYIPIHVCDIQRSCPGNWAHHNLLILMKKFSFYLVTHRSDRTTRAALSSHRYVYFVGREHIFKNIKYMQTQQDCSLCHLGYIYRERI